MKQLSFSLSFYLLIYWLKHNKLPFFYMSDGFVLAEAQRFNGP